MLKMIYTAPKEKHKKPGLIKSPRKENIIDRHPLYASAHAQLMPAQDSQPQCLIPFWLCQHLA